MTRHPGFRATHPQSAVRLSPTLYAFDLLELDGEDLRGEPIEVRKHALTRLLRRTALVF